ncbi:helix-turn-helix transcriptional regulator [Bacillus paralicheniformis]|uniref:helix-turn-helix domain-containing protein n=1 Tax=Bacillus paralicheniformis TaxID=1648923 RepID=UPI0011AB3037|nr:helix-turn-helix transcriptional regulator [Bacillus paralicheniformis]MEC1824053.1 helix-turn-helix transcriptional regulator [Bacillus paralicheniformis]TWK23007.1 HTH-type transcriptional regulator Xre [Bacillus paralicheniformis]
MLGDRLRELRESRKLTQDQLAEVLGISRGTYAHYEINKRKPDYDMLIKIADYYNVSTDYLLRGVDQKEQDNSLTEEAKKILNDPKTFIAARDGEVTDEIVQAALEIIVEQLKEGRKKKSD